MTLPPGRARTLDKSVTDRVRIGDNDNGNGAGGSFSLLCAKSSHRDDHIDFAFGKLLRQRAKPLRLFGRKTVVQLDVLAFEITKLVKRFSQGAQIFLFLLGVGGVPQHADARHRFALLRARGKRPRRSGAAEKRDEFTSSHMTLAGKPLGAIRGL